MNQPQNNTQPDVTFVNAPLVHLIDTDPKLLNPQQLQAYLAQIRELRGSAQTKKAATRAGAKSVQAKATGTGGVDLGGLLS